MIVLASFLGFVLFYALHRKYIWLPTAFPAILMSFGIVNVGVFHLPEHTTNWTLILFFISTSLVTTYALQQVVLLFKGKWKQTHFAVPQQAFTFGTWVAGGVVYSLQILHVFAWNQLAIVLFVLLFIGWLLYISHVIISLVVQRHARHMANGTYLLPTVATQAIILFANTLLESIPPWLNEVSILLGIAFYIGSVIYLAPSISKRNWNGTYCILHGALSITGVASLSTGSVEPLLLSIFWVFVLILFVATESFELYRLTNMKLIGHAFRPHISNWSRLFTFGMFYTFTYSVPVTWEWQGDMSSIVLNLLPVVLLSLLGKEIMTSLLKFFVPKKVFNEST